MRFKDCVLPIFVAIAFNPLSASGQNLFRTNRPSYTKAPNFNYQAPPNWQRPSVAAEYSRTIGRLPVSSTLPPTLPPTLQPPIAANQSPYVAPPPVRYAQPLPTSQQADEDYRRIVAAWQNYRAEMQRYQLLYGGTALVNEARPSPGAEPYGDSTENRACCPQQFAPDYPAPPRYDVAPSAYSAEERGPNPNRLASPSGLPADQRPSLLPSAPPPEQRFYRPQNIGNSIPRRQLQSVPPPWELTPRRHSSAPTKGNDWIRPVMESPDRQTQIDDPRTTAYAPSVQSPPLALAR